MPAGPQIVSAQYSANGRPVAATTSIILAKVCRPIGHEVIEDDALVMSITSIWDREVPAGVVRIGVESVLADAGAL